METDDLLQLSVFYLPDNASILDVKWVSSDPSVAVISEDNVIHTFSPGEVELYMIANGDVTSVPISVSIVPANLIDDGEESGHGWVDLGLPSGLKWASCNIGASSPREVGEKYAWGEVSVKESYTGDNYKYYARKDDGTYFILKYNDDSQYGNVDNKSILELSDDAARVNWGGNWRIPSDSEFNELKSNCSYEPIISGGNSAWRFVSHSTGKSIVIIEQRFGKPQRVWSSTLVNDGLGNTDPWTIKPLTFSLFRHSGNSVRPVTDSEVRVSVEGVSVSPQSLTIKANNEYGVKLSANITPSNATQTNVVWSSSNTDIARVSAGGYVYGYSAGKVKIIATTYDGGFVDECEVTVIE